jgi:hypothetical protein
MNESELVDGSAGPSESPVEGPARPTKLDEAGISQKDLENAVPLEGLDPHDHKALVGIDHWQDIKLKKKYANWLLWLVTIQLVVADGVFIAYAWAGESWHLQASVIQVWLVATLVELIGVALVITRYLFPRRDHHSGAGA